MRLIYIANARIPTEKAHGIQIMKMCEAFSNNGVDLELVLPKRKNFIKEDPYKYYGVKNNFKITKLACLDFVEFGKIGFYIQSLTFSISAFFYVFFKKVDILYSRDELPLYFLSFFKNNLAWEIHVPKWNFISKRILKKSKKIITITNGLKEFYTKKGINKNKILVAPDGVCLKGFDIKLSKKEIRKKLSLPQDKKIILYSGHLYDWKGVQALADASSFFDNDVLFVFVGGADKDIKQFKNKNKNKNKKNILVIGRKPHCEIPFYLKSADILVLPNSKKNIVSEKYTSPMKLFEYMASGVPIVASDLPSIREILNEKNAVLVKPDNPKSLAEGIKNVLNSEEFSKKRANNALLDVREYTWENRVLNILNFIK